MNNSYLKFTPNTELCVFIAGCLLASSGHRMYFTSLQLCHQMAPAPLALWCNLSLPLHAQFGGVPDKMLVGAVLE